MAEFCKQCSEELELPCDLVGLSTEQDTKKGLYSVVICETCGPIQVDHEGKCISPDCKYHQKT